MLYLNNILYEGDKEQEGRRRRRDGEEKEERKKRRRMSRKYGHDLPLAL